MSYYFPGTMLNSPSMILCVTHHPKRKKNMLQMKKQGSDRLSELPN